MNESVTKFLRFFLPTFLCPIADFSPIACSIRVGGSGGDGE